MQQFSSITDLSLSTNLLYIVYHRPCPVRQYRSEDKYLHLTYSGLQSGS